MTDSFLDDIEIASPCPVNWDGMVGNDRTRYCSGCKKNVYNISEMSRKEAEALIGENEGEICVRLFRKADGTVLNNNCPVGLRRLQLSMQDMRGRAFGLASAFLALAFATIGAVKGQNQGIKRFEAEVKSESASKRTEWPLSAHSVSMGGVGAIPYPKTEAERIEWRRKDESARQFKKIVATILAKKLPKNLDLAYGRINLRLDVDHKTVEHVSIMASSGDKDLDEKIKRLAREIDFGRIPESRDFGGVELNFFEIQDAQASSDTSDK